MLNVHRSERADLLEEMLAEVIAPPLADALAPEIVAVPTRGIERWLAQQLSRRLGTRDPEEHDGVCANVDFPFPGTLVGRALAGVSEVRADADPWAPERSVWPLLEVVEASLDDDWLRRLADHLANAAPAGEPRRFAAVRHIADLFDHYGVHRPELVRAFASGDDPVSRDERWQGELWRRLRARIGIPSPAERLAGACAAIREQPGLVDLPERVSLFGLTRLPASYVDVLAALAAGRDVHLFLLHPSAALWASLAEVAGPPAAGLPLATRPPPPASGLPLAAGPTPAAGLPLATRPPPPAGRLLRRSEDRTAGLSRNPLLSSWGLDAREMQLVLRGAAAGEVADEHRALVGDSGTLLGRIQADVVADRVPPGAPFGERDDSRVLLEPGDRSIEVHACHGRARQVEVLRDCVLHLLKDRPDLEPRDVIVMCPDIETFAPLIHATFGARGPASDDLGEDDAGEGAAGGQPPGRGAATGSDGGGRTNGVGGADADIPDLRARLADRSLRQTNPVLGVVARLLELAASRVTASEVLDLAAREPVRRRFRFDDDDLSRLEGWVVSSGVRWGLDAAHRAPFKLDGLSANTWRAGLDRALLGVAVAERPGDLFGGVLPLDDVGSDDIELAGRFAELVDRLESAIASFGGAQPIGAWTTAIAAAADSLVATSDADAWQLAQLERMLEELTGEATLAGVTSPAPLCLADVRALLADRLRGRPTRANFRTGHLTICTLVPMRSVPHRVVCLLGLDDGSFPRNVLRDGDDLIQADPCVGDRDSRSEDRQLLLDALMAATEHLVITYSGRDERTNIERPPAVPVGELLDVIDRTVRTDDGSPARSHVVVHHPLQPFDERNFTADAIVAGEPWSFDRVNLAGARELRRPRTPPAPFLSRPLEPFDSETVELDRLERFLSRPVRAFLRARLGVGVSDFSNDVSDSLPVELDALEEWTVGERMLGARLGGATLEACLAAERARGTLPPGELARATLDSITGRVEDLVAAAGDGPEPESIDVRLALPDGTTVVGTVSGVRGDVVGDVTYSRLGPSQRLAAWLRLLAVSAARPDRPFSALTIGRGLHRGSPKLRVSAATIPPLASSPEARREAATCHLQVLLDLYRRGMREPLPLYRKTSAAWAAAARTRHEDPVAKASGEWVSSPDRSKEDKEPEHLLVFGEAAPFERLLAEAPGGDEGGEGWAVAETTRFGRLARRLWDGLLDRETVDNR